MKRMILFVVMMVFVFSLTGCGTVSLAETFGIGYTEEEKAQMVEMEKQYEEALKEREEKLKNPELTTYRVVLYTGDEVEEFDIQVAGVENNWNSSGFYTYYSGADWKNVAYICNDVLYYKEGNSTNFSVFSGDFKIYPCE